MARRRRRSGIRQTGRLSGVVGAVGISLVAGNTGLAVAPPTRADVLDAAIDQILTPVPDPLADLSASDPVAAFDQAVYAPLHADIENWISSSLGQRVDGVINKLAGSLVIGNGAPGTPEHPDGFAGGWLFGDGGHGWNSTFAGIPGGNGGAGGLIGDGGDGGDGGPGGLGAGGGDGGTGGTLMGIGGEGGDGGPGEAGDVAGAGGAAPGWLFGIGGAGGDGGTGEDGGDGGDAGGLLGTGGAGGSGDSGDSPDGLPALGGAGGTAGLLGDHGVVGRPGTPDAPDPSASEAGISTTGRWFTDGDGKVVIMHGLNEVYKVPPNEPAADGFSNDDAAFLAANGFNAVRVGVIWSAVEPEPGVFNDAYLASIAQTVQTLHDHGIVAILDMHQDLYGSAFGGEGAPAWATETGGQADPSLGFPANYPLNPAENHAWDAFWSNADGPDGVGLENSYAQLWEHVAAYFKDDPGVAGFEIMNEPWPGSQTVGAILGDPSFGTQTLTPFYDQVTAAIRAVDPSAPVLFEPNTLFDAGLNTQLGTVDGSHTVFAFHDVCGAGVIGIHALCPDEDALVVGQAASYAGAHHIPALLTEIDPSGGDALQDITSAEQAATKDGIGWLYWAYTGQGDVTTSAPGSEALVTDPHLPPTGDNVDTARLDVLTEPYPQLVAGTPGSWSFDPSSDTFTFSYSTEMADGSGHFPAGSTTTISVPDAAYPNGYQVSVSGGHVVSVGDAARLVIAANPGATTVSVAVTAAAAG